MEFEHEDSHRNLVKPSNINSTPDLQGLRMKSRGWSRGSSGIQIEPSREKIKEEYFQNILFLNAVLLILAVNHLLGVFNNQCRYVMKVASQFLNHYLSQADLVRATCLKRNRV